MLEFCILKQSVKTLVRCCILQLLIRVLFATSSYMWTTSRENLSSGCATRWDSNRPAQLMRLARVLKFRLWQVEVLYYPGNEQLRRWGERGGSVVECRTPEREVRGSRPTAAVLCPWARHFTPRKYWLITQEAMAPSRHDWKIVDWDVKPQHNQLTKGADQTAQMHRLICAFVDRLWLKQVLSWHGSWHKTKWVKFCNMLEA